VKTAANRAASSSDQAVEGTDITKQKVNNLQGEIQGLKYQISELQKYLKGQTEPAPRASTANTSGLAYDDFVQLEEPIINYSIGLVEPSATMRHQLEQKAAILKKYPGLRVICTGYTCDFGSEETNYVLGLNRAVAAQHYFTQNGIDANRIEVKSGGQTRPIAPNDTDVNRRKNRRVEITVVE
jgi:outer membrane protein OmpA-like peptidoglycan-associated protein